MEKKKRTVHRGLVRSDHRVVTVSPLVPAKPSRKYVFFRDTRDHRKMAMDRKLEECYLNFADTLDDPEECVRLFNDKLWAIFDNSFPLIKVSLKMSSRHPPYMSPLVKHLCNLRNKISRYCGAVENQMRQEKINSLIRMNQVQRTAKIRNTLRALMGLWDTANMITGRKTQGIPVSSVLSPEDINVYFQSINSDQRYVTPEPIQIPEGSRVPTADER